MSKDLKVESDIVQEPINNPNRNLCAAVLMRAIEDLLPNKSEKIQNNAKAFFLSRKLGKNKYLSFSDCCQSLDLNPDEIERAIAKHPIKFNGFLRQS